ncbi:MAG: CvpA family protein [Brevinema sp.]
MNIMDLVMMIFLFLGAFQGFGSGFVRTLSSWAAPLLALIAVNKGLSTVLAWFPSSFHHRIGVIFVAVIVFVVIYFLVHLIGRALKHIVNFSLLGSADHIAGLFLGIFSSAVLIGFIIALGMQFSIVKNPTPLALFLADHSAQTLRFLLGSS